MKRVLLLSTLMLTVAIACSPPAGIEEGYLDVNGTTLFYKAMGSGSGHWLFVDATDTFRDSILEFLARVE